MMLHSLSAQVSYYSGLIQKNPDWKYAGVYADDFISGTNTVKRDEFKRNRGPSAWIHSMAPSFRA